MSSLKLYEIAPAFKMIADLEELGEAELQELDSLNLALTEKVGNIAALTDNLEVFVALCDTEEKRIKARKAAAKKKIAWLNDYLKFGMQTAGLKKIEVGTRSITLQNNPPKVIIDDEAAIPAKFFVIVPESLTIDKRELKAALKDGEIPGAHMEQGQSIRKR